MVSDAPPFNQLVISDLMFKSLQKHPFFGEVFSSFGGMVVLLSSFAELLIWWIVFDYQLLRFGDLSN
jgi:drug/metabolite transporter superfamily protein YnfA